MPAERAAITGGGVVSRTRAAASRPGRHRFVRQMARRDVFLLVTRSPPSRDNYRPDDRVAARRGGPSVRGPMAAAQPVMNPEGQAQRFDPNGTYVERYSR
jgi:hypothetical protein